jgi:putative cell wall-binding protein/Leucine-rich repeat (LRR) protein
LLKGKYGKNSNEWYNLHSAKYLISIGFTHKILWEENMRKKLGFFNFLLAFILTMSFSLPVFAQSSLIPDTNLESSIKSMLGLSSQSQLTVENLQTLYNLYNYDGNVASLQGLENASNLGSLDLENGHITDLTPLQNLTKLWALDLGSNQISDLTPLKNLTSLYRLNLANNKIPDVSSLANLNQLKVLDLSQNQITDISPIKNILDQLRYLSLYQNNISDISSLAGSHIADGNIDLSNNQISDISPLSSMSVTDYVYLDLSNNKISSLDALKNMTATTNASFSLYLSNNYITDISGLSSLKNGEIDLSDNLITDISPLSNMVSGTLNLSNNPLNENSLAIIQTLKNRGVNVIYTPATRSLTRVSGATRYDTAVEIAKKGWQTADAVVIATGADFPDALAGAPLAYQLNAPILLTDKDSLLDSTKQEISSLKATKAIVLGGTSAVSTTVEDQLKTLGITNIERLAGQNRFETASLIAAKLGGNPNTAIVAYGYNYPDALSVASYAAQKGYPILLTNTNDVPSVTTDQLAGKTKTIVVGGEAAVSNSVSSTLPGAVRIGGSDRFETAANLVNQLDMSASTVYVATGRNFADALTGSVLAAKEGAPMLLVEQNSVPGPIYKLLSSKGVETVNVLGGSTAVTDLVGNLLAN